MAGCLFTLHSMAASTVKTQTAEDYFINDQQVEQLFANSVEISVTSGASLLTDSAQQQTAGNKAFYAAGDKNFATALLLNFFLGFLGIHRLYLGTKTLTWVGYILTCGGIFGIVPLIDLIVLIVHNNDITPYVNNPKFFMWGSGSM